MTRRTVPVRARAPVFTRAGVPAIALFLLLHPPLARARGLSSCPSPDSMAAALPGPRADVRYLASDALREGADGSADAGCSAIYLAGRFRALGLRPAGPGGSYFQTFTVRTGAALGRDNRLWIGSRGYALGRDWVPFGFSASAVIHGRLVYAGSGLDGPGEPQDLFSRFDPTGKIAVVDWGNAVAVPDRPSRRGAYFRATVAAAGHAAALIVLLPEGMALPSPDHEIRNALPIPVVAIAGGPAAESVRQAAAHDEVTRLSTDVHPVWTQARNVVAELRGTDPGLRSQYVIVGARFGVVRAGADGSDSGEPDLPEIDSAADADASGPAGMLDVAGRLADGPPPGRSVLFVGFTGVGRGRWSTSYFAAHPTIDLSSVVAMLDLDRIGSMVNHTVAVFGTGGAGGWSGIVAAQDSALDSPLALSVGSSRDGAADQASLRAEGIPVLHFSTDTGPDGQRSGYGEGVNAAGLDEVADLAARITQRLAGSAARPPSDLVPVREGRPVPDSAGQPARRGEPAPYLGAVPDSASQDFGVLIAAVQRGSPADTAGLRAGDLIVEIDGEDTPDLDAYTYVMREQRAGEQVTLLVERDGRMVSLKALLAARP